MNPSTDNLTARIDSQLAQLKTALGSRPELRLLALNTNLLDDAADKAFRLFLEEALEEFDNWDSDTLEFLTEVQESTAADPLAAADVLSYFDAIGLDDTDLLDYLEEVDLD